MNVVKVTDEVSSAFGMLTWVSGFVESFAGDVSKVERGQLHDRHSLQFGNLAALLLCDGREIHKIVTCCPAREDLLLCN
jgi:hypothetical protein